MSNRFPILDRKIGTKRLVYLDNASSMQKPQVVIDAVVKYYTSMNANVHRGVHHLSEVSSMAYDAARARVASFIGCVREEVVFTRGTTSGLNMVARMLENEIGEGDEIVLSIMEHHSNIVCWQELAKRTGAVLKFIGLGTDFTLDMVAAAQVIGARTKVMAITAMSNVLGTVVDVNRISEMARKVGAYIVVDAAQIIAHEKIDVRAWDVDFMAFSGHKMYGPTGVGVLYGKKELLEKFDPVEFGGGQISEVGLQKSTFAEVPAKFEAGTPPIAQAIALGEAIEFIEDNREEIVRIEREVTDYALGKLVMIEGVKIFGSKDMKLRGSVISFEVEGVHSHDVAEICNRYGVAVRAGHHCCQPLMKALGVSGTVRASFAVYNTCNDVDVLCEALVKVKAVFG